jgi:putative membrane protein
MILEILSFSLSGILIGVFAGIIPGMHINVLLPLLLSFPLLIKIEPYYLVALIVSAALTEIFVNFISSIFVGAPDSSTALSVLPGHKILLEGRGYEAIKLTVIGGIGALILSLLVVSSLSPFFKILYDFSRPYMHWFLIGVTIFMLATEKKLKKIFSALLIFFLSGFLGIITLNSSLTFSNILFPLLTGLFGLPTLLTSIFEKAQIPKQEEDEKLKISKKEIFKSIILGSIAGVIIGFLPAIGISEAAVIVQYLGGANDARNFLITLSGINVGNEVFSLISLYLVNNPRSGTSVAIQKIFPSLNFYDVVLIIGVICFSSGLAAVLTLYLGKKIPKYLEKINYTSLCISVIILIFGMIFLLTGVLGLLIAFTSTSIGLLCINLGIRRSHCMGCLLLPSILFFSGTTPCILILLKI